VTTLILGASAGLGRSLARALARKGHSSLILVSRDARDLKAEAAHLRLTLGCEVITIACDAADIAATVSAIRNVVPPESPIKYALFPIGVSRDDDDGQLNHVDVQSIVNINLNIIVSVIQNLLPDMEEGGASGIVGFGSIASARGRNANMVYAAAKRALESYFESLRHRTADTNVNVQFYRLGYLDTSQTFGKSLQFPIASPEMVANMVVENLDRDVGKKTYPRFWNFITFILKYVPWFIYKKINF